MDSLTQIVLGAAVGEAVLGKKAGNRAMLWGAIFGTVPDLDVLSKYFVDSLSANELHRGFSHSIVFCILLSLLSKPFFIKLYKNKYGTAREWMFLTFAALFTHIWLDAHTTWGTQVFWPLGNKVSFNNIFVIDPLYTLPFLFFLLMALSRKRSDPKRRFYNTTGIVISSSYMLLTILFKNMASYQAKESIEQQQIVYSEFVTRPTPFNSLLWTITVETDSAFLIGYYSLLDKDNSISFTAFAKNHHLLGEMKNEEVVKRLIRLSQNNYIVQQKDGKIYFNDLRFGQRGMVSADKAFVFSYELNYGADGTLQATEVPKSFRGSQAALHELYTRMKGI